MPPKKAATAVAAARKSSRASSKPKPEALVNGIDKPAVNAATTKEGTKTKAKPKSAAKPTTKASTKGTKSTTTTAQAASSTSDKGTSKKSNKRRAEEEVEDEPKVNGKKRAKVDAASPVSESADEQPKKRAATTTSKAPTSKITAPKKQRVAAAINHAPKDVLNVYVFGDGTNGELGLGVGKNCAEVKRPRLNPHLEGVGVVEVSVGGMHTAVLTKDNKILTWGVNDQGALGRDTAWDGGLRDIDEEDSDSGSDSDTGSSLNPRESTPSEIDVSGVPEGTIWTQLATSDSATFALSSEGLVYGCGTFRSNEGIFGFSPTTLIQKTFTLVPDLKKVTRIAAGANHVLALDNKGCVFAWGSGQQNQLGRRILERFLKNSLVPTPFGLPKHIVNIGAGAYHSFAMHKNGKLYSWGLNSFGETGVTRNFDEEGESDVHHAAVVTALDGFGKVVQIEGGSHHTIALTDKGEVLVWGRLDGFQLGLEISKIPADNVVKDSHDHPRILKVPMQVPKIDGVAIAAGSDHSLAVAKDGKAYAWGFSVAYQTGLGTDEEVEVATHIDNTAVRGKQLVWAGAGGQFSVLAGLAGKTVPVTNGHA